jgi:DNA polymerase-3 subunit gamma/tau
VRGGSFCCRYVSVGARIRVQNMSLALYRTYRPTRLDEVVGQEHVTVPLSRALTNDRVHHAYLFSGPRGCGKTSTARILARSLNCERGPTPDPCGVCQSCVDLAANGPGSIDVIELDAASHGGVDDTRELRERAMFAPVSSRYKVYIIDEAHMVSPQGFNALLKLVEEPPEHVRFIFATTEVEKVIPTIRSRTHNYTFRLVPVRVMTEHLAAICEQEGIAAESSALALVARAGGGSVRDSLSILGQVIAGCGPQGVTHAEAAAQLGLTDAALLDEAIDAIVQGEGAQLFMVLDRTLDAGHEPRRFTTDLLERLRDLVVIKHVPGAVESGLIDAPTDQVERMAEQAAEVSAAELSRAADVVSRTLSELRGATAPRLLLELMAARLLLPGSQSDPQALTARMDQLERRVAAGSVAAPTGALGAPSVEASTSAEPAARRKAPGKVSAVTSSPRATSGGRAKAEAPTAEPTAVTGAPVAQSAEGAGLAELRSLWPAVLDAVKEYSRVAWMVFSVSAPLSLQDGVLAVGIDNANKVSNARASGHDERLRQAIMDVVRIDVRIDVVVAPDVAGVSAAGPPEADIPSPDDADAEDVTGVELAMQALGATQIGEIEHS